MGSNSLDRVLGSLYKLIDYEKLGSKNPYETDESDLHRFRELLRARGDNHKRYKTILIAGSKGKGSTSAMLESILRADGRRTGFYSSPHLVDIRERFRIDGNIVEAELLSKKLEDILPEALEAGAGQGFRTVFEILTASAFELFAEAGAEIAVIEVGLGGRLDATNVIDPDLTIITPIGLDHTNVLGETYEAIAREKAGILRHGIPLILAIQRPEARKAILLKAESLGAHPIIDINEHNPLKNISLSRSGTTFDYSFSGSNFIGLHIPLLGAHQAENAAVAVSAANYLDVGEAAIREGLGAVDWPARMQIVASSPDILIDGAHSPMAFERLIEAVRAIWRRPPVWLFAANRDKDVPGMLELARGFSAGLYLTSFDWPRAMSVEELKSLAPEGIAVHSNEEALALAREAAGPDGLVVIAGSLYLAGVCWGRFATSGSPRTSS